MAKQTFEEIQNNPEFAALQDVEGIDAAALLKQAGGESAPTDPPPTDPPPTDPPPTDPPPTDPPPTDPPPVDPSPTDPAPGQQDVLLKEIFDDRFQTVEDAKSANIVGILDEVVTLRQEKADLTSQLELKPKTNFANDEVALFNEFVKETGTRDYQTFKRINDADVANMEPMDALITQYRMDHPGSTVSDTQLKGHFEKKYNVDPDMVDEADLVFNQDKLVSDGGTAKKALQEVKDKLKVPELSQEPDVPKELTPEEKTTLQTGWNNVGKEVSTILEKLKVPIKNGQEPLLDYEISEADKEGITTFVTSYALENHLELDDANKTMMAYMVRSQLIMNKLPEIVHSVFEKARSLTEEQVHAIYANPSPATNNDTPPASPDPVQTDLEKQQDEIFNAEMDELNK